MNFKYFFSLFIAIQLTLLTPYSAFAIDVSSFASGFDFKTGPSEYVIQEHPNQKLISVRLLSGVSKPGLYRIPTDTNLMTLLSYSGGLNSLANTEEITIKTQGAKPIKKTLRLADMMSTTSDGPVMQDNDTLFIPEKEPLIDRDTIAVVSLTSSIIGIIAIVVALSKD